MNIKHWYTGVVEDVADPLQNGRVRVRAFTYHTPSQTDLPTADLPWATCMMPVTQPSMGGIGQSATGLVAGSWVFGFFRDGDELQDPVVVAVIPSNQSVTGERGNGFADPNGIFPISAGPDMPAGSTTFGYGSNDAFRNASSLNQFTNATVGQGGIASTFQNTPTPITVNGSMSSVIAKARGEVGVKETSTNQGPGIAKYWSAVDYSGGYNDRAPWCAAFVSWCIQQGGIFSDIDRPKHAAAFDFEKWARSKSPGVQLLSNPKTITAGMIVIFSSSHIGIATTASDISGNFRTIEGNTNAQGSRDGNGVWEKSRNVSLIRSACVVG